MNQKIPGSKETLNLATLLIMIVIIAVVQPAYALTISDVKVTDVTAATAKVSWKTDVPSNGEVLYGITETTETFPVTPLTADHSITLDSLKPNAKYTYRIKATTATETKTSPSQSFITKAQGEFKDSINIETSVPSSNPEAKLPEYTNQDTVTITGKTTPGVTITLYVNSDRIPAQILESGSTDITSKEDGTFSATIRLFDSVVNGIRGYNKIIVEVKDAGNNVKKTEKIILVDKSPPRMFLRDIPASLPGGELNVAGSLSEAGKLIVKVDDDEQEIDVKDDFSFNETISIGDEGKHKITIIGRDPAGNEVRQESEVLVDTSPCTFELENEPFSEAQRFPLITVKGKTSEPKCDVYVANLGSEPTLKSLGAVSTFADISSTRFIDGIQTEFRAELEVSVGGFVAGHFKKVTSDSDGTFSALIALKENAISTSPDAKVPLDPKRPVLQTNIRATNYILIAAVDSAGNIHYESKTVTYEPGSGTWKVGRIVTVPNTVYSDNLMAEGSTGVTASVMYDIYYIGPNPDQISDVRVTAGIDGKKLDNNMIQVLETFSRWKPAEKKVFVMSKIKVLPHRGTILDLKKEVSGNEIEPLGTGLQVDFALVSNVNYRFAKTISPNEAVYFKHAIGIETPFDYSRFLTPEILNKTIKFLDKVVEILDTLESIAEKASYVALAACAGSTVLNYFEGVGEGESNLKRTYQICDRIWCPTIPADCENLQRVFTDNRNEPYVYNEDAKQYIKSSEANQYVYNKEKSEWQPKPEFSKSLEGKNPTFGTPDTNSKISYRQESEKEIATYRFIGNKDQTPQYLKMRGQTTPCAEGESLIEVTTQSKTAGDIRITTSDQVFGAVSHDVTGVRYTCIQVTEDQFKNGQVQATNVGCYKEGAPEFHETKCWPADANNVNNNGEISPYEDIVTSTQCGCISGIRGHLANFARVARGMKKCLQQAMIGEVRAGYCERLFAQFTCDLISSAVQKFMKGAGDFSSGEGSTIRGNFNQVNQRLQSRYGSIIQSRYGLSADNLVHKACIAAISGDWSDLRGVFQQATRIPVKPIFGPLLPVSRFTAWNPFTGEASINYYMTVGILSGGQAVSARLRLICDRSQPGGEFCPPSRQVRELEAFYIPPDGSVERNIFFQDDRARYWYNVAEMDFDYQLAEKFVTTPPIREAIEKKSGLIAQCHWQVFPPQISCDTLSQEGAGGAVQLLNAYFAPKQRTTFYPGNKVNLKADYYYSTFGQSPEETNVYLVYDIKKPDGTIVSNRQNPQNEKVDLTSGKQSGIYNIYEIPTQQITATSNSFGWVAEVNFGEAVKGADQQKLILQPGEGILIAAQTPIIATGKTSTNVRRVTDAKILGLSDSLATALPLSLGAVAIKCEKYNKPIDQNNLKFSSFETMLCVNNLNTPVSALTAQIEVEAFTGIDEQNNNLQILIFKGTSQ